MMVFGFWGWCWCLGAGAAVSGAGAGGWVLVLVLVGKCWWCKLVWRRLLVLVFGRWCCC
jgi:hypothetical protein